MQLVNNSNKDPVEKSYRRGCSYFNTPATDCNVYVDGLKDAEACKDTCVGDNCNGDSIEVPANCYTCEYQWDDHGQIGVGDPRCNDPSMLSRYCVQIQQQAILLYRVFILLTVHPLVHYQHHVQQTSSFVSLNVKWNGSDAEIKFTLRKDIVPTVNMFQLETIQVRNQFNIGLKLSSKKFSVRNEFRNQAAGLS